MWHKQRESSSEGLVRKLRLFPRLLQQGMRATPTPVLELGPLCTLTATSQSGDAHVSAYASMRLPTRLPTAQIANKKPPNQKSWGEAPATQDFSAPGRPEAGVS